MVVEPVVTSSATLRSDSHGRVGPGPRFPCRCHCVLRRDPTARCAGVACSPSPRGLVASSGGSTYLGHTFCRQRPRRCSVLLSSRTCARTLDEETAVDRSLRSPSAGIEVSTTERGLPMALKLDEHELTRPANDLANEILFLCQLGRKRQQVARRRELAVRGVSVAVIRGLNLCSVDDLERAESRLQEFGEDAELRARLGRA